MTDTPCDSRYINRSSSRGQCDTISMDSGDVGTSPALIEEELNKVFERRLADIQDQTNGDATLKEITYKEWIDMLRNTNRTLITNIEEIEKETTKRLTLLQRKANVQCRCTQSIEDKYKKDIAALIQLVRNGKHRGDWSIEKFSFETISDEDIFGNVPTCCQQLTKTETESSKQQCNPDPKSCAYQKNKLIANVKALAFEVADKHDEIRDLKKQVLTLEDEIQNAQKKIQLKDDVIKELRNDLKHFPKFSQTWASRTSESLSPNLCFVLSAERKISETCDMDCPDTPRSCKPRDSINSLNLSDIHFTEEEDDEEELIKYLKLELNQLFEIRENYGKQFQDQKRTIKEQQERINEFVDKLIKINNEQLNKLKFYRRELINLENPHSNRTLTDVDSGISSDLNPEQKIINAVRSRISNLVEENQRLQISRTKYEDLMSQYNAKSVLLDKTSKALREVTDEMSNALCKPIDYEIIFRDGSELCPNPVVDALKELLSLLEEKDKEICNSRIQLKNHSLTNQKLEDNCLNLEAEIEDLKKMV